MVRRPSLEVGVFTATLGLLVGCASSPPEKGSDGVGTQREGDDDNGDHHINQIQIQETLQRFVGVFLDRTLQAAEPLMSETAPLKMRTRAMHQVLLYATSSIDIATGRFPETNLLDMLAFVDLTRGALTDYWIPEVYGEKGRPLEAAFEHSGRDLDRLAGGILTRAQLSEVHRLVQEWRRENPGQHRVEQIRPFLFAAKAGELATEREREAFFLLDSVRKVTQSTDQAVLLAERAMFLSQRMPFLIRFHARLSVQELIRDGVATLQSADFVQQANGLRPLVQDASTLAARVDQATDDSRAIVEGLRPLLQPRSDAEELRAERLLTSARDLVKAAKGDGHGLERAERALTSANSLTDRAIVLLEEVRAASAHAFVGVGALAAFLMALFWTGRVVSHRLTRGRARDRPRRGARERAEKPS
jgi:hypothetical protein